MAETIKTEATKTETAAKTARKVKETEDLIPEVEKIVTIKIPKTRKDEEDVVVWVNERRFLIKRGVFVDVPESVALILEQQEKMLQFSFEYESKVQH